MRWMFLLLLGCLAGCKDESARPNRKPTDRPGSDPTSALLSELETLPVGLRVTHTPAQVRGPVGPNADPPDWRYRWIFKTEVSAVDRPVTITQFGILAWDGAKWILPPDQSRYNSGLLDQRTFVEWYSCPRARIEPGKPAVDPQNWAGSHERISFQQQWFFIGVDADGKRCKGEAVVQLLADGEEGR